MNASLFLPPKQDEGALFRDSATAALGYFRRPCAYVSIYIYIQADLCLTTHTHSYIYIYIYTYLFLSKVSSCFASTFNVSLSTSLYTEFQHICHFVSQLLFLFLHGFLHYFTEASILAKWNYLPVHRPLKMLP